MLVNKIIKLVLLLLGGIYIVLEGLALEQEGAILSTITLVLLTWLYVGWSKHKSRFFLWFLIAFTLSKLLSLFAWYGPKFEIAGADYYYYVANILYILAYLFLIIKISRSLNFKKVFSELTIPILVLIVLDIFCVSLITDTAQSSFSYYQYILEFTYNAVVMLLLSFALINYMYRNNNKSMLFLIGSIFIVFSEIIQLAYYYILPEDSLGYAYAFFLVVAFVFLYMQSQFKVTEPIPAYTDEQLEV